MGKVLAVCVSEQKGTLKQNIGSALFIENHGVEGDAHAGNWHRQVSLLSYEKVEEFRRRGADVTHGSFGENLVVTGMDFKTLPVGTRFLCADVILELTQIGKECHHGCAIYQQVGDCIMPREGVFAKVIQGGKITVGDEMKVQLPSNGFTCAVITASDTAFAKTKQDESGPLLCGIAKNFGYTISDYTVLSDAKEPIVQKIASLCDTHTADLVLTTGGTGFSSRDNMPEATLQAVQRETPGIAEALRAFSMQITPRAMLSRGVAGIRGTSLVINLPGSPKAVRESAEYILPHILHGLEILTGKTNNCARKEE